MRLYRQVGNIKAALFGGAVVLISGLLLYTQSIIEDLREESRETVSLYARLMAKGLTEATDSELDFVFREIIQKVEFPIIYSDREGTPVNWRNLPGEEEWDQESVSKIMKEMDSQGEPIPLVVSLESPDSETKMEVVLGHLHYGDSALIRTLRILPYVEIGAVAVFILLGFIGFQVIRKNEKQHIWLGMARETTHQLGTPVSSLMGWLQRLRDHPGDSAWISEQMAADVARLRQIGDRFARMGSHPPMKRIDIKDVLSEAADYLEKRLPQTGKNMELNVEGVRSVYVEAIPTLLSWAIENLLKNAIDAIDKPTGVITVRSLPEGREAVVLIEDNGKGIARRDWKNVFRPGYTTKERGWGLGLSLTRRIIEEHLRGTVRIRSSEVGKGTMFEVRLRAHQSQVPDEREPPVSENTTEE